MFYEEVKKGDAVFHISTVGDKFYVTLSGKVNLKNLNFRVI